MALVEYETVVKVIEENRSFGPMNGKEAREALLDTRQGNSVAFISLNKIEGSSCYS